MIPYEEMSEDAKRIFATADLFGDGGKAYNADFAARIIDEMCSMIYHDWDGWEVVDHFRAIAKELKAGVVRSTSMSELSPAAEAVLNAALPVYDDENLYVATMEKHAGMISAAAIKAVADQVVPEEPLYGGDQRSQFERDARQVCRKKFFAIAAELEGAQ